MSKLKNNSIDRSTCNYTTMKIRTALYEMNSAPRIRYGSLCDAKSVKLVSDAEWWELLCKGVHRVWFLEWYSLFPKCQGEPHTLTSEL